MSWSVNRVGTQAKVREACEADFDRAAKQYEGQEEMHDVLAAKERALTAIDGIDTSGDTYSPSYGIEVKANGSRSKWSCNVQLTVSRVALAV